MIFLSKADDDCTEKHFIDVDFGVVPVGSVHKRMIDITNNLKASPFYCNYNIFTRSKYANYIRLV